MQQQPVRAAVVERNDFESEDRWSNNDDMRGGGYGGGSGGGRLDASAAVADAARGGAEAPKMMVRKQTTVRELSWRCSLKMKGWQFYNSGKGRIFADETHGKTGF